MTATEILIPKALTRLLVLTMLVCLSANLTDTEARQLPEGLLSDTLITSTLPVYEIYIKRYSPDSSAIRALKNYNEPVDIRVFFGEWCHDSSREIPRFMKVISEIQNPNFHVQYHHIARNDYKVGDVYREWSFSYTPTILLFEGEKEIGRIVEEPVISMETDLLNILNRVSSDKN